MHKIHRACSEISNVLVLFVENPHTMSNLKRKSNIIIYY